MLLLVFFGDVTQDMKINCNKRAGYKTHVGFSAVTADQNGYDRIKQQHGKPENQHHCYVTLILWANSWSPVVNTLLKLKMQTSSTDIGLFASKCHCAYSNVFTLLLKLKTCMKPITSIISFLAITSLFSQWQNKWGKEGEGCKYLNVYSGGM